MSYVASVKYLTCELIYVNCLIKINWFLIKICILYRKKNVILKKFWRNFFDFYILYKVVLILILVNRVLPSFHRGSLEITLTVPLISTNSSYLDLFCENLIRSLAYFNFSITFRRLAQFIKCHDDNSSAKSLNKVSRLY